MTTSIPSRMKRMEMTFCWACHPLERMVKLTGTTSMAHRINLMPLKIDIRLPRSVHVCFLVESGLTMIATGPFSLSVKAEVEVSIFPPFFLVSLAYLLLRIKKPMHI